MPGKFSTYTAEEIVNLVKDPQTLFNDDNAFSREDCSSLIERINEISSQRDGFELNQIAAILNGLSNPNYDNYLIKSNLEIVSLTWNFDRILRSTNEGEVVEISNKVTPYDVIETIKGCANLGYDKGDMSWDITLLSQWISLNINSIFPNRALVLLHSLSKMGYEYGDQATLSITNSLSIIFRKAREGIEGFKTRSIVDFVYSLARAKMFIELFEVQQQVKSRLGASYLNLNHESASALLQVNLICRSFYGQSFFAERELKELRSVNQNPLIRPHSSTLQNSAALSLEKMGYRVTLEWTRPDEPTRAIDIRCENDCEVLYVEVDGKSHYLIRGDKLYPNSATRRRDEINKWLIAPLTEQSAKPHYYITLPYSIVGAANFAEELFKRKMPITQEPAEEVKEIGQSSLIEAKVEEEVKEAETELKQVTSKKGKKTDKKGGKKPSVQPTLSFEESLRMILFQPQESQQAALIRMLQEVISVRDVRGLKNILASGVVDPNAKFPETNLTFLNWVLWRMIPQAQNDNAKPNTISKDLQIIEALVGAGFSQEVAEIEDVESKVNNRADDSASKGKGKANRGKTKTVEKVVTEFFNLALDSNLYNAATFLFTRFNINVRLTSNADDVTPIVNSGCVKLIIKLAEKGIPGSNERIWDIALSKENSEEILEGLIGINFLPTCLGEFVSGMPVIVQDLELLLEILFLAVKLKNENIVEAFAHRRLIEDFQEVNKINILNLAAKYGDKNIFNILRAQIRESLEEDPSQLLDAVYVACKFGQEEIVAELISEHPELLSADRSSEFFGAPIHIAASFGQTKIIQFLCEAANDKGINDYINCRRSDGFNPLCLAISKNHIEAAFKIISMGADLEVRNLVGDAMLSPISFTLLTLKQFPDNILIFRALIEKGVQVNHLESEKEKLPFTSPLFFAAVDAMSLEACLLLIRAGAKVNVTMEEGDTLIGTIEEHLKIKREVYNINTNNVLLERTSRILTILRRALKSELEREGANQPSASASPLSHETVAKQEEEKQESRS